MRLGLPVAIVVMTGLLSTVPAAQSAAADGRPAPPLPTEASRWVGEPQTWKALRGQVTLVFVWTFG
jgi:hypothetical protein